MEPISSTRNRSVVEAGRLHRARDRHRSQQTLIEGPHLLDEAIAAGVIPDRTFCLVNDPGVDRWPNVTIVSDPVLERLAGTETPRGPVAVISIPPPRPPLPDQSLMVLWGVSDPGNVGTIIRSCAAFGLAVAVGPRTADVWSPKVLRAGAGSHFRVPILSVTSMDECGDRVRVATVVDGGASIGFIGSRPVAVMIGDEARGLPDEIVEACDHSISIPMPGGVESLNASVAASIIAYELSGLADGSDRNGPSR